MPKMKCQKKDSKTDKAELDYRCKKCGAGAKDDHRLCKPVRNKK